MATPSLTSAGLWEGENLTPSNGKTLELKRGVVYRISLGPKYKVNFSGTVYYVDNYDYHAKTGASYTNPYNDTFLLIVIRYI